MNTVTYHLDQNVRGHLYKGHIDNSFLNEYEKEAILPFSLLEYAGIRIKDIFQTIDEPQEISNFRNKPDYLSLLNIKHSFDNQIRNKLSINDIKSKLNQRCEQKYAELFRTECLRILPDIYKSLIIPQLSWDRFNQMKWSDGISTNQLKAIHKEIAKLIIKQPILYTLRFANYTQEIPSDLEKENESIRIYLDIMNKVKIKPNVDIGDCEFIHTAINGQLSPDCQQRRKADCYTMDPEKEIKRRLILCLFFYEILEKQFPDYQLDRQYFSKIYVLDNKGREKEIIDVKDYQPRFVVYKIKNKDLKTLFLLNS